MDMVQQATKNGTKTARLSPEQTEIIRRNPPIYMNLLEAAAYLNCSPRKLRYDAKARLIPYLKLRGKLLFRRDAVDEALKRLEVRVVG